MPPNNKVLCIFCEVDSKLRKSEEKSLFLFYCPKCNFHGQWADNENLASRHWNTANKARIPCLGCNGKPRFRYSKLSEMWFNQCTNCGWHDELSHTLSGAMAGWAIANRAGSQHIWELWQARYSELFSNKEEEQHGQENI